MRRLFVMKFWVRLPDSSVGAVSNICESSPSGKEDWQRSDEVAKRTPGVFEHKVLQHVVANLQTVDAFHPSLEFLEPFVQEQLLHLVTAIEGNFFGIGNQTSMESSEVTLSLTLDSLQLAKWR
jgi:hypothetical protein